ncbi:hypothetical protein BDZ45DRAFT_31829 [Acephala macrosclerotiorum]|nr:hypothetical protein BDZ45DRAFT_31829 [Acephala macrosclerotiorum]
MGHYVGAILGSVPVSDWLMPSMTYTVVRSIKYPAPPARFSHLKITADLRCFLRICFLLPLDSQPGGSLLPLPPVKAREAEASIYDTAHTLKMAEDEYQKHDPEANLYGTAHTLKTAQDEYKKRDAEVSEREANLTEPLTL